MHAFSGAIVGACPCLCEFVRAIVPIPIYAYVSELMSLCVGGFALMCTSAMCLGMCVTSVCMFFCIFTRMYMCMHACMHVRLHEPGRVLVRVHICMHMCMAGRQRCNVA